MKKLIQTSVLFLFVLLSSVFASAQTKHILVPAEKAEKVMKKKNVQVLDVRTPEEVKSGHLPNALNYDFKAEDFGARLRALDKDRPYLVYCRSGVRSGKTVEMMRTMGFRKVYELDGGIIAYKGELAGQEKEPRD